ncbi:MAG: DUF4340 domain-containing protein [Dehalococcoidales bacterium]|nr:DUF4340 domain-containing protein [Dehalococcoidales bacterium]
MKLKGILILAAVLAVFGTIYYFVSRPVPETPTEPRAYVWDFEMDNLQKITMSLPKEGKSESFVKNPEDRNFYFDNDGPKVDVQRWGGGIPLLLSGPGASRVISYDTTNDKLTEYGFDTPNLIATLTLDDESIYEAQVGDSNPDGTTYYVRLTDSRDVYTVDASWYEVLARIVTEPPYVAATFTVDRPTVSAAEVAAGTPVIVSINVQNTGNLSGSYDVSMKINSELRETKTVTLNGQESAIVTFTVTESQAGKYIVSINTRNVTFIVK